MNVAAAAAEGGGRHHILLVGNPGTGKSTLLNSLVGSAVFKSGVTFGEGLTTYLQWHDHLGYRYASVIISKAISIPSTAALIFYAVYK